MGKEIIENKIDGRNHRKIAIDLFNSLLEAYKQSQIYIYDEHSTSADNTTEDMDELDKEIEEIRTEFDNAIKHWGE